MRGLAARLACGGVRVYQMVSAGRPQVCRYAPSCSVYAVESLQRHGLVRGLWLTVRRLSRCHPWGPMGWDPVPDRRDESVKHRVRAMGPVARAARERSQQKREAPRRTEQRHHLPRQVLSGTSDLPRQVVGGTSDV